MTRKSVLVVEDDPDIIEVLVYNLSQARYDVQAVTSGEEALTSIRGRPPSLVLLDLMLPGMHGLDVCRHLKDDPATAGIPASVTRSALILYFIRWRTESRAAVVFSREMTCRRMASLTWMPVRTLRG